MNPELFNTVPLLPEYLFYLYSESRMASSHGLSDCVRRVLLLRICAECLCLTLCVFEREREREIQCDSLKAWWYKEWINSCFYQQCFWKNKCRLPAVPHSSGRNSACIRVEGFRVHLTPKSSLFDCEHVYAIHGDGSMNWVHLKRYSRVRFMCTQEWFAAI